MVRARVLFRQGLLWNCLAVIVLFCLGQSNLMGQTSAQITGLVTDASGAAVPNASVTVANLDTGIKVNTVTNATGN